MSATVPSTDPPDPPTPAAADGSRRRRPPIAGERQPVVDRQRRRATSYTVERSDGTTGDWSVIASGLAGTATSWVDSNVTAGASYSYEVEAFDGTAGSPNSNVASATVPYATPAAPTNLTATASASPASVSLRGPTTPPMRLPTRSSGQTARRATGPSSPAAFRPRPPPTWTAT